MGPLRVREMKYHQSNIRNELIKREHETLRAKVFLMLDPQLPKQVPIKKAKIKQKLDSIYKDLGISAKASAKDINE